MRIAIITAGSRGDVQPYVALALGLQRAGHLVRVATHETFRGFVTGHGLEFAPVAGDPRAVLRSRAAERWLATGRNRNVLGFVRELRALAPALVEGSLADYWQAMQGADALVFSVVGVASLHVAERLDVPAFAAFLQPFTRTREFPAIGLPQRLRLGGAFNLATHAVAEQAMWRPFRRQVGAWRRETLGLAEERALTPHGQMAARGVPTLYGFSRHVVPRPADWGAAVHLTGYWFLDAPAGYEPPPALRDFLAAGPPPVYLGFGSMTPQGADALTRTMLGALERAGLRGVLLRGWGSLGAGALPPWAIAVDDVPHEWLFPRMAAVVHHGGAGTTAAGLRSGVPSLVVPLGFDQPYWGWRVAQLGVGPRPIARKRLTVERLARALREATGDEAMRERAARLGAAIRAEDGVGAAVEVIDAGVRAG
ncbi:MAG: UDP-glucose:sterol glucosyltransferase [uncultured Gemmatimonadaceae bacterium]|uniref:UDP-glucose:sterol glucosyltransferase n=1 Tax=uncultured Gemmatimonadaceae bacterium TaxID=246130 RepID=A0A6J4M3U1_9BACT|nr:MAG: UDP-glucose:sterol glucosyltransferase [uncultured Gemmatimonadaceae bacterium]